MNQIKENKNEINANLLLIRASPLHLNVQKWTKNTTNYHMHDFY